MKGMEIERKWKSNREMLPEEVWSAKALEIEQGYLCTDPTVRVRREGENYYLTYKGRGGLKRREENLPLNKDAYFHLRGKCDGRLITKTRYLVPLKGKKIEEKQEKNLSETPDNTSAENMTESMPETLNKSLNQTLSETSNKSLTQTLTAEVDIFHGELDGLVYVEVEFSSIEDAVSFAAPAWFGEEVTGNHEYSNAALALR